MTRFRPAMGWLHNWLGLLLGWLLFVIFVTGSFGYYRHEVTLMMTPELHELAGADVPQDVAADQAVSWLEANAREAEQWSIHLPDEASPATRVSWFGASSGEQALDPRSGAALSPTPRETGGGDFLYRIHSDLHFVSPIIGRILVTLICVALLVLLVTGLVTHRNILKNLFRFRRGKGWRTWLDLHNLTGVLGLPFHLFITLTGLVTVMMLIQPWGVASVYGTGGLGTFGQEAFPGVAAIAPDHPGTEGRASLAGMIERAKTRWQTGEVGEISVEQPGAAGSRVTVAHPIRGIVQFRKPSMTFDAVDGKLLGTTNDDLSAVSLMHSQLFGLHVGHFAGPVFRFVLFWLGLVGAAMVATGHLLWTAKRWPAKEGQTPRRSVVVVDRLNAAVFAGLPIAIAAYFWANRLIPADTAGRAGMEQNAMFWVWGAAVLLALLAPRRIVWPLLLALGGGALISRAGFELLGGTPGWTVATVLLALGLSLLAGAAISARRSANPAAA